MIVLIDNYDSFSYNVYQLIGSVAPDIKVVRNDEYSVKEIEEMKPEALILSPGPGRPAEAGICIEAIRYFAGKLPILGICLGHQAICEAFGGEVSYAKELMHGKKKTIYTVGKSPLFEGLGDSFQEAETVMDEIMSGQATAVQMSSYLTALSMKGETIDEITASAAGMRAHCIKLLHDLDVLEIVGTGGDGANSFNISTTSSLVIAAGGVPVAKHGNRAASSKSGAADVLEALGVNITIPPEKSAELLKKINICFLFAQNYHIAMKYVAPIRKELGIRTVFNILGPLSNPAGANMELMGVFDQAFVEPLAQVMAKLGVTKGMVVFGQDKLDEISMSAPTSVCEIKDGWFQSYEITPEQFGYERCSKDDLAGGTPAENAEITKAILRGEEKGPKRQAVCLNAGAALYIAGKAETMEVGVRMAEELIDNGSALKKLDEFIACSNE